MSKDSVDVLHGYGMCFKDSVLVLEKIKFAVPQQSKCTLLGIIQVFREPKFNAFIACLRWWVDDHRGIIACPLMEVKAIC